jgi:hypothetical protein
MIFLLYGKETESIVAFDEACSVAEPYNCGFYAIADMAMYFIPFAETSGNGAATFLGNVHNAYVLHGIHRSRWLCHQ